MGGNLFHPGSFPENVIFVCAAGCNHLLQHEVALGDGAGLIHNNGCHVFQHFHGVAALEQDAQLGTGADAREEGQGHAQYQGAGAADDQEGQGGVDPFMPVACNQGRYNSYQDGQPYYDRCIDPRETGDEFVDIRLVGRRVFHRIQDLGNHGFLQFFLHADLQHAGGVDAAGQHFVAVGFTYRHRFAGNRGGIQQAFAFDDHAVQRNAVAYPHQQDIAHPGFRGGNHLHVVADKQVDHFRTHIHRVHDLVAAPVGSPVLEPFAHPVEEDNAYRFFPGLDGKGA